MMAFKYVAEVQRFFSIDTDNDVQVWLKAYNCLATDDTYGSVVSGWEIEDSDNLLLHSLMIDDTLIWTKRRRNVIVVIAMKKSDVRSFVVAEI